MWLCYCAMSIDIEPAMTPPTVSVHLNMSAINCLVSAGALPIATATKVRPLTDTRKKRQGREAPDDKTSDL